jgi:hypothetical protein
MTVWQGSWCTSNLPCRAPSDQCANALSSRTCADEAEDKTSVSPTTLLVPVSASAGSAAKPQKASKPRVNQPTFRNLLGCMATGHTTQIMICQWCVRFALIDCPYDGLYSRTVTVYRCSMLTHSLHQAAGYCKQLTIVCVAWHDTIEWGQR